MRPLIGILLNSLDEFNFEALLRQYLPVDRYQVEVMTTFPNDPSRYQLIVPWSYQRKILEAEQAGNVVIIHSSNLPEGRGWAPIFYAFQEEKPEYVVSVIFAANEVDTGDIILRARFRIDGRYTAPFIRELDEELSLILIAKVMEQWPDGRPKGIKQTGIGSYNKRRYPKDNEIDIAKSLKTLIPHLRGVEASSPAFFIYNDEKYLIEIKPALLPKKPKKVIFEYPALNKLEVWTEWQ